MRTSTRHPTFPQYLPYTLLAALACATSIRAANITDTWNPALTAANWSNAADWSAGLPGTDPTSLYDIQIQSASTSQSILYDLPLSSTNLNSLTIDATSNHTATFSITDNNTLTIQNTETIGLNGNTAFIQTAGTNSVGVLLLASNHGSNATYTLGDTLGSNPTLISKTAEEIGGSGNATFTQYSGNNNAINLFLGFAASGTYNLAGGNLTLAGGLFLGDNVYPVSANFLQTGGNLTVNAGYGYPEFVGYNTSGNFTQLAGNHTVASDLNVGFNYTTSLPSTYILGDTTGDAPTLSIAGNLTIGNNANGSFTQYSGNLTTAGLFLSKGYNSKATFTLNGGNFTITTSPLSIGLDTAASGVTIFQNGGNLFVNGSDANNVSEYVGYIQSGNFTQTNGNHTVAHDLVLGQNGTYPATYTLGNTTGGNPTLSVLGSERLINASNGSFIQYSGNNNAGNIIISAGNYTLNGGNVTLASGNLYIGSSSPNFPATFIQNAGNITAATGSEYVGYATYGNFSQLGGTNAPANLYISFSDSIKLGTGTYTLGNFIGANPSLSVSGTEYIGYSLSNSAANFIHYSGNNTTGSLILGGTISAQGNYSLVSGNLNITTGALYVGHAPSSISSIFNQSGGNIFANGADANGVSEYIGDENSGNFTQSGGNNIVSHDLVIGPSSGTYTLGNTAGANPTLTVLGSERIGANSFTAFLQYSGNNTTANLYLGNQFSGNYTLSGGNLTITTGNLYIGAQFNSLSNTLTQNAGNVTSANSQYIGAYGYGNYYQLNGNSTIAANLYVSFSDTSPIAVGNYIFGTTIGTSPSLTVNGTEYIGYSSTFQVTGTFKQYSGNNTTGSLTLGGGNYGASGLYTLYGGNLTLTSGPLSIGAALGGTGTFTQYGGNIFANAADASGTSEYLGSVYAGNFTQFGGNNTLDANLVLSPSSNDLSVYNFNGLDASLTIHGSAYLGGSTNKAGGFATFRLYSGNVTIDGTLKIWPTNMATIEFNGGYLSLAALDLSNSPYLFQWAGGNLTIKNNATFDPASNNPTSKAFGSSLTLHSNKSLTIVGDETLGGISPFALILNTGASHTTNRLTITPNGSLILSPGISLNYSLLLQSGGTLTGTLTNQSTYEFDSGNFAGTLINNNTAILTADTGSSTTSPLSIISAGNTIIIAPQHLNSLSLQSGDLNLYDHVTKTNNFSIAGSTNAWTGLLNLTSAALVIEDTANHDFTIANLRNQIAYAPAHDAGITSSNLQPNQSIAIVDNAIAHLSSFGGDSLDDNSIIITPAYIGDFNLDGVVDIQDLTIIANHWQQPVADWSQGDSDNNKIVDIQDLTAIANNWQVGITSATTQSLPLLPSLNTTTPSNPTPEPSSLSLLFISAAPLLLKRKR